MPAVPGCSLAVPGCPRLFPGVFPGCSRLFPGCPRRGPQVAGAARRSRGCAVGRERRGARRAAGGGRRPTEVLLSLQVELLPERDLDSDGTKISVSVDEGAGSPRRPGVPSPVRAHPAPSAESVPAPRLLPVRTAGCG